MPMAILDRESFKAIAAVAYRESGLTLVEEKCSMIQSRLRHRLRALDIPDFESYTKLVQSKEGQLELKQFISALTTNVSHFFREKHHFDILCRQILAPKMDALQEGAKLRIWSAGCANGQEAFSIAISLLQEMPDAANLDIKILATDIDPVVVKFAADGRYPERFVSGIPAPLLRSHFTRETGPKENVYEIKPALRNMVRFKELNVLGPWPMKGSFDAIFCRNVVIYFDQTTQDRLWPRFRKVLDKEGYLFLGHSERIANPEHAGFASAGPTSYQPLISLTGKPALEDRTKDTEFQHG